MKDRKYWTFKTFLFFRHSCTLGRFPFSFCFSVDVKELKLSRLELLSIRVEAWCLTSTSWVIAVSSDHGENGGEGQQHTQQDPTMNEGRVGLGWIRVRRMHVERREETKMEGKVWVEETWSGLKEGWRVEKQHGEFSQSCFQLQNKQQQQRWYNDASGEEKLDWSYIRNDAKTTINHWLLAKQATIAQIITCGWVQITTKRCIYPPTDLFL